MTVIDWTLFSNYLQTGAPTPGYRTLRFAGPTVQYTGPADIWGAVVEYFEAPNDLGIEIRVGTEIDPAMRNTNQSAVAGPTGPGTYTLYASVDTFDGAAAGPDFLAQATDFLASYDVVLPETITGDFGGGGAAPFKEGTGVSLGYWDGGFGAPANARFADDGVTPNPAMAILMGQTGTLMTDGHGNGDTERVVTRGDYEINVGADTSAAGVNPALNDLDPQNLPDGYVAAPVYDGPIY